MLIIPVEVMPVDVTALVVAGFALTPPLIDGRAHVFVVTHPLVDGVPARFSWMVFATALSQWVSGPRVLTVSST